MKRKIGDLIYNQHYKDDPGGAIYIQDKDGCRLITSTTPAASLNQEQHNKEMRQIVDIVNQSKRFKQEI